MKILAVSDVETGFIHSPALAERFTGVELAISCGDLSPEYLDFIQSALDVPLYYVLGNHDRRPTHEEDGVLRYSGASLHRRVIRHGSLTLAGLEGSLLYNREGPQYSQAAMWAAVLSLAPALLASRIRTGRRLDIFASHAPPWGIHDVPDDPPHRGFKAFRWLIRVFQPAVLIHGHIHLIHPAAPRETLAGRTRVINAYGWREIELGSSIT